MTSRRECAARAALCRQLAKLEPLSSGHWLAEAKRWRDLAQDASAASRSGPGPDSSQPQHEMACLRIPGSMDAESETIE